MASAAQALNVEAIVMFLVFVAATLVITKWAANRTRSAADFYAAGGGITGFQNGLAIAGDYMSAASFLGISGLVFAVRLRRPDLFGRLARRLADRPVPDRGAAAQSRHVHLRRRCRLPARSRARSASCRRSARSAVVAFYLIAQMVGAGKLIELLFGLPYLYRRDPRRRADDRSMSPSAAWWRPPGCRSSRRACCSAARPSWRSMVLVHFDFSPEAMFRAAIEVHPGGLSIMAPGEARDRSDLGDLARPGADVRHRRPAAYPDALLHGARRQGRAQVGVLSPPASSATSTS